jgi:hypothetical protein
VRYFKDLKACWPLKPVHQCLQAGGLAHNNPCNPHNLRKSAINVWWGGHFSFI